MARSAKYVNAKTEPYPVLASVQRRNDYFANSLSRRR